ncbi:MAG: UvrD-helicase domain-containing protein [bacterium]
MMNFPHILVMSASAGSGKTFALSQRYIHFILSPAIDTSPRNILAITFTNKATAEMKDRIISGLKACSGLSCEGMPEMREMKHSVISQLKKQGLEDPEVEVSARQKLDELLDRYSDLKVQTIDSFLTSVAMSSALELGLPPHFEISLDSGPALKFVLDELLSQVYWNGPNTSLFLNLVQEFLRINQEISWDIKTAILENISSLRKQEFLEGQRLSSPKDFSSVEDIDRKRKSLKGLIEELLAEGLDFKQHFIKAANNFLEDKELPWEKDWFLKNDVAELCHKNSIIKPYQQQAWDEIRKGISALAEIMAHGRFSPFLDIAACFDKGLRFFKARRQIILMEELPALLESFLRKEGIVPEIYFHLGDRIAHFFIDEFQDTSRLQWRDLFPLIEETLSKRGSLFYVGDKKQAIYGFRGGESALFEEAKDAFVSLENANINEEFPQTNYRSREDIVSFVNDIFSYENLSSWAESSKRIKEEEPDLSRLFETYRHAAQAPVSQEKAKGGLVRVERISPDEPLASEELKVAVGRRLVNLINNDLLRRFSPGEIAVLVRTNDEAAMVTSVLSGADIPVASARTLDISSNHLIQEIVSFLAFLDSPIDDFSFACFISGEIFLKISQLPREEIFSFLLKNREIERPLYTLFRDKFPEVWKAWLEEYFNAVGFLPPYDLLSRILKKYEAFQSFPDEEGFFYQLLEIAKHGETQGQNSLKAFLGLWSGEEKKEEIFQVVLPEYTDAVKVMTIHKAKGLGFPVVINPFTYLNDAPIKEVYEKEGDDFIPYRINKKQAHLSPKLKELRRKKFASQLIEELNTFYVTLTRAKDELYIFIPEYKSMTGKLPTPILFEEPVFESGSSLIRQRGVPKPTKGHKHPPLTNEWQDKLHRPKINVDDLVDVERKMARQRGTLIHQFLAGIERLSLERWGEELEEIFASLSEEQQEIVLLMRKLFDEEGLRHWFILPDDVNVYCEKEIVDDTGQEYRADRVLVYPEKAVVIEFKTGEPRSEEHQRQVRTYLELLADIYSGKEVEGWLVYVDEASQEKVEVYV